MIAGGVRMAGQLILSIDGGGLRGILSASLLVALERSTGKPARDTFHFVAGTSSGAILAAGIAAGIPARDLLTFFLQDASAVFTKHWWTPLERVARGWMYDSGRLRRVLVERLSVAGGWQLNDAPVDVLISATRLRDGKPWYFVRDDPRNAGRTGRLSLADCVVTSAAEPTYFRPWPMPEPSPPPGDPIGTLVGGGVGVAGNPVYQACVEAFFYAQGYTPEDAVVVSLGTGRYLSRATPTWIVPWVQWVLGELLRSPGEQQTALVWRHSPQTPLYRLDMELPRDIPLDDVASCDSLRVMGERFASTVDWSPILLGMPSPFLIP